MKERKNGQYCKKGEYYRVKTRKPLGGGWTVAEYLGEEYWFLCGNEEAIVTEEIEKIGTIVRLPKN